MKNEISNRRPDINLNDVEKGDVLLSCGRGELSHAIRLLDGEEFKSRPLVTGSHPLFINGGG